MDDMCQHISLSRRLNNIAKPRLCNTAAECYRQSKRPRGSNEPRGRCCVSKKPSRQAILPQTVPIFVSLRGRSAAVAILKSKVWHPGTKHGSGKQDRSPITKNMDTLLHSASSLFIYGSVSFCPAIVRYGMTNRFVKDCRVGRKIAPSSQ